MSEQHRFQQQLWALLAKAAQDAAFRERLLRNPEATRAQEGIPLPPDMTTHVYEDPPTTLTLALQPKALASDLVELSNPERRSGHRRLNPTWCIQHHATERSSSRDRQPLALDHVERERTRRQHGPSTPQTP
jgi:hypothetical protein